MSEPRLYLYRKAGREVWDAEMWLPDGLRRVWRTGIADHDEAERAARARLEALVASTAAAPSAAGAAATHEGARVTAKVPGLVEAKVDAGVKSMMRTRRSASLAEKAAPAVAEPVHGATWSTRFDRWFFGELGSLWRARA